MTLHNICVCRCAGKVLHQVLTQHAESESEVNLAERFATECIQMSKARHPNIVLFLGVYFQQDCKFPILVMEYLPMCLDECLSKYRNLPPYVKNNILLDVAHGLQYLHGMNIIHRDLTAKNVLIGDNLRAKIADLGVAKITATDVTNQFQGLTCVPGNANYMSPEAFAVESDQTEEVEYDYALDIFSYGVLVINTVTHKWPNPIGTVRLMKEIERRRGDLDLMGENHPLRSLAERCLGDKPDQRPPIVNIVSELEKVITNNPAPFRNTMELLQDYCRCSEESKGLQSQLRESEDKRQLFERRASQLGEELGASSRQISVLEKELQSMQLLLQTKEREIDIKESLLRQKEERIQTLHMKVAVLSQDCRGQVMLYVLFCTTH